MHQSIFREGQGRHVGNLGMPISQEADCFQRAPWQTPPTRDSLPSSNSQGPAPEGRGTSHAAFAPRAAQPSRPFVLSPPSLPNLPTSSPPARANSAAGPSCPAPPSLSRRPACCEPRRKGVYQEKRSLFPGNRGMRSGARHRLPKRNICNFYFVPKLL